MAFSLCVLLSLVIKIILNYFPDKYRHHVGFKKRVEARVMHRRMQNKRPLGRKHPCSTFGGNIGSGCQFSYTVRFMYRLTPGHTSPLHTRPTSCRKFCKGYLYNGILFLSFRKCVVAIDWSLVLRVNEYGYYCS